MGRDVVAGIVLGASSILILLTVLSPDFGPFHADETHLVWNARRVAAGAVPYRDLATGFPPLLLYGLAALSGIVPPSIGPMRLLTVAWVTASTLLLFAGLRGAGLARGLAFATALLFPAAAVALWPVTSHYWFAFGFGIAAAVAGSRVPGVTGALMAGLMAGAAFFTVQTVGLFTIGMVVISSARVRRTARPALAFTGGWVTAAVLAFAGPARDGVLVDAARSSLVQVARARVLSAAAPSTAATAATAVDPVRALEILPAVAIATLPVLTAALLISRSGRRTPEGPAWTHDALVFVLVGALLYVGGLDLTHLVLWTPAFLLLFGRTLGSRSLPRPARVAGTLWLGFALLATMIRVVPAIVANPPSPSGPMAADSVLRRTGPARLVGEIQPRGDEAIVLLSPYSSGLYLYWAPDPPPVDWVVPPADVPGVADQHARLARFLDRRSVAYVVVPSGLERLFMEGRDSLSTTLRSHYDAMRASPWGLVLRRR